MKDKGRYPAAAFWILIIGALCFVCVSPFIGRPDPAIIVSKIPLGSRLSQLEKHMPVRSEDDVECVDWTRVDETYEGKENQVKNEWGSFLRGKSRTFRLGAEVDESLGRFCGVITFWRESPLITEGFAGPYAIELTYVDGKLVKKNWGYLPG